MALFDSEVGAVPFSLQPKVHNMQDLFLRWVRAFISSGQRIRGRTRLACEILEDRTVPTATWIGPATGLWNTAANWSGATGAGGLPGSADDVVIANANVSHSAFVTDQIKSL